MARITDLALLGPKLALGAARSAAGLVPKALGVAGSLLGGDDERGERPDARTAPGPEERPAAPTSQADRGAAPAAEAPPAEEDVSSGETEIPDVRSTVPQAVGGGFPEPPGDDPGDISRDESPHHALSTPVGEPDPTEWPDPYDRREDPRDPPDPDGKPFGEQPHPQVGSRSTSDPHPNADIEAGDTSPPERDRVDD